MKLMTILRARSIWLFDLSDLNPKGKTIFPEIVDWLTESYGFQKHPSSDVPLTEGIKAGLVFQEGSFQVREEYFIDVDLTLYADGIVADTRSSTTETDAFINDVLKSVSSEFSLPHAEEMIRQKLYVSEVDIKFEKSLGSVNQKIMDFSKKLSDLMGGNPNIPIELSGLNFWADPNFLKSPWVFQFERKINRPFSEFRYYSQAPLQTDVHLSLLEELENILLYARS